MGIKKYASGQLGQSLFCKQYISESKCCVWYAGMHSFFASCYLAVCHGTSRPSRLTWGVTLNHWMVVHLESGIATAACEAYYVVLAIIYSDGGLIDGDVICPHIEDDPYLSLVLWVDHNKNVIKKLKVQTTRSCQIFHMPMVQVLIITVSLHTAGYLRRNQPTTSLFHKEVV